MRAYRWRTGLEVFVLALALVAIRGVPAAAHTDSTTAISLSPGLGFQAPLMLQATETGGFDAWGFVRPLLGLIVAAVLVARIMQAILGAVDARAERKDPAPDEPYPGRWTPAEV